jgi:hypothetical protein
VAGQTRAPRPDAIPDHGSIPDPGCTGPLSDAVKPDIHGVRTHWIRGFMTFQLARGTWEARLMMPVLPESGFRQRWPGCGQLLGGIALEPHETGSERVTRGTCAAREARG